MWYKDDVFDLDCDGNIIDLTYDSELDEDILNVLKCTSSKEFMFYDEIAKELKLDEKYVQLILHLLSHLGFTDYGTSPRGSWISESGEKYLIHRGIK